MLEVLFIIIAGVFWLVSSVNKQKQKQAEQQKREAAVRALQAAAAAKSAAAQAPHSVPAPSICAASIMSPGRPTMYCRSRKM